MFRVALAFLLFATVQGTDQNDTDIRNSLSGVKSDIQDLKDILADIVKKPEHKPKWPITQDADCTWKQLEDPVLPTGILIPHAITIEACRDACERTSDCQYFDWIAYLQLCYLPIQPRALRYELNCGASTANEKQFSSPILVTVPASSPKLVTVPAQTTLKIDSPTQHISTKHVTIPVCKVRLDLAFVVDGSTSICSGLSPCENWNFNRQFIHKIVEGLIIGSDDTRVALVIFSNQATVEWNLNVYTNKTLLLSAIDELRYPTGATNTTGALKILVSDVFTRAAGDRPDVPNTSILITDGIPTTESWLLPAAINTVHRSGIKMLVVGVTNSVNEKTVRDISSPPQKVNVTYFLAKDYSSIDVVRGELHKQTCTL